VHGRWLLLAVAALLVLGGAAGYLIRGGAARSAPPAAGRPSAAAADRRLIGEVRTLRLNADRSAQATLRLEGEMLRSAGAQGPDPWLCTSDDFPTIHVAIRAPAPGSRVRSPIVAHLLTDRPLGCDSEYYIRVDGRLYEGRSVGGSATVMPPPETRGHPLAGRPALGTADQKLADCFGGPYHYVRIALPPGRHTISIAGGCAHGTEVPQPVRTSVSFTVTR
jgi:hypothetical protein